LSFFAIAWNGIIGAVSLGVGLDHILGKESDAVSSSTVSFEARSGDCTTLIGNSNIR
jgi:hypothetical protein